MPWHRNILEWDFVEARFSIKLNPCPFCSADRPGLYPGPDPHVVCLACGAEGPVVEERGFLEERQYLACQRWNQRGTRL